METKQYINGVRVIHYDPTPLESIQCKISAQRIKRRLEKKLKNEVVDHDSYEKSIERLMKSIEGLKRVAL